MPAIDSGRVFSGGPRSLSGSRSAFHCPQPESSEAAQSRNLALFFSSLFFLLLLLLKSPHEFKALFTPSLLIH